MSTGPDDSTRPDTDTVPEDAPVDVGTGPDESVPLGEDDDEERFDAG